MADELEEKFFNADESLIPDKQDIQIFDEYQPGFNDNKFQRQENHGSPVMDESPDGHKEQNEGENELDENADNLHPQEEAAAVRKEALINEDDLVPEWEKDFIDEIRKTKTIPNISLIKFRFVRIEFEQEDELTKQKKAKEPKQANDVKKDKGLKPDLPARKGASIRGVFERDDGPYNYDYKPLLSEEFWSEYTDEKRVSDYFNEELDSKSMNLKDPRLKFAILTEDKKDLFTRICNGIKRPIVFLAGSYLPERAPKRVHTPEEIFKVMKGNEILKPNQDIKSKPEYKTRREKFNKYMLIVYKFIVDKMHGRWPRKRVPSMEEAFQDMFIWAINLEDAKKRFSAILNDEIAKEII